MRRSALLLPALCVSLSCSGDDGGADAGPSLQDVQELFATRCSGSVCHVAYTGAPAGELDLTAAVACANLVGVPSVEVPSEMRLMPGDPSASYLVCKIEPDCADRPAGAQLMPLGGTALPDAERALVSSWVGAGAPGCGGADRDPPSFAGATAALGLPSAVRVDWSPATDDTTPSEAIEYLVFMADQPDSQSFDAPVAVTAPGATSHTVGGLPISTTRYLVVRARDQFGNVDRNTVELSATTADTADETPPSFAGIESAAAAGSTAIEISWSNATDDVTPASAIRYRVYVAGSAGAQNFGNPSLETAPGATAALVSGLAPETDYFVVVRAVDATDNEDTNTVERSVTTGGAVSFAAQVQPILTANCASMAGCHGFPMPAEGLDLRAGHAYADLVGVASGQCAGRTRVIPSDPDASYLAEKITVAVPCFGTRMPKTGSLGAGDISTILDWIAQGALDN